MFQLYGFFIGVAMVVGYSVAVKLDARVRAVAPWVLGLGLIGARGWHVLDLWSYYSLNPVQVVAVWQGGLSIWGGIMGGGLGFFIGERREERGERWKLLGAIATAMPLAQAIGRIGNGVNGEFGNMVWILPWWGMEAILDLVLFGILWGGQGRGLYPPARVWIYVVGYGLIRLVLSPYRL